MKSKCKIWYTQQSTMIVPQISHRFAPPPPMAVQNQKYTLRPRKKKSLVLRPRPHLILRFSTKKNLLIIFFYFGVLHAFFTLLDNLILQNSSAFLYPTHKITYFPTIDAI